MEKKGQEGKFGNPNRHEARRKRKFWFLAIRVSLAGVLIPPAIGQVATVLGLMEGFGELSRSSQGDPESQVENVSDSIKPTMWGLGISELLSLCFLYR